MVDGVHRRKTDRQIVWNIVLAQALVRDQRLGKIIGQPIADRADQQQGAEQFTFRRAEGVGEGSAITLQLTPTK